MTVKELIVALYRFDQDIEVRGYWEGITVGVKEVRLKQHKPEWLKHRPGEPDTYVELDVDG
jgi:hypothetical protein